jgi:hypothetical protein
MRRISNTQERVDKRFVALVFAGLLGLAACCGVRTLLAQETDYGPEYDEYDEYGEEYDDEYEAYGEEYDDEYEAYGEYDDGEDGEEYQDGYYEEVNGEYGEEYGDEVGYDYEYEYEAYETTEEYEYYYEEEVVEYGPAGDQETGDARDRPKPPKTKPKPNPKRPRPTPKRPQSAVACAACDEAHKQCRASVGDGSRQCIADQRALAREFCSRDPIQTWNGATFADDAIVGAVLTQMPVECKDVEDRRFATGKCRGALVEWCIRGYMEDHPSTSEQFTTGREFNLSFKIPLRFAELEIGGKTSSERTVTVTVGPRTGIRSACNQAASRAMQVCSEAVSKCKDRYCSAAGGR